MTTPYRLALLLATGLGALYALVRAWRGFQIYYDTREANIWQPPLVSEFYLFGITGVLLSLVFILLGFSLARHFRATKSATEPRRIEKRNYLAVGLLASLLAVWGLFPANAIVSGVQNGRPLDVGNPLTSQQLEMLAIRLLISCDYEAKEDIATEARWQQALEKPHVHLVFAKPRKFCFAHLPQRNQPVSADEMLISISHRHGPDYVLVKFNGQLRAFTRWTCEALTDLQKLLPTESLP